MSQMTGIHTQRPQNIEGGSKCVNLISHKWITAGI